MHCPRCGADNPIPEATKHQCHNCGYSLIGEVSKHDVHSLAARRAMFRVMLLIVILAGIVYAAVRTEWFGLRAGEFTASESPSITTLFAPDPIDLKVGDTTIQLKPSAEFSVQGIVLANQRYGDGRLLKVSERDLILAWGQIAVGDRKRIQVVPHDRSVTLSSADGQFEGNSLISLSSTLHIIPATDAIKKVTDSLSGGARIGLQGLIVSTTIEGENFSGVTDSKNEGEPRQLLLYVTSVTLRGKTFGLTVGE